jgi:hypothetical protein
MQKILKEEAERAGWGIIGELVFVLLPFVIMAIVYLTKGTLPDILQEAEWSLASTILSGQIIVKTVRGAVSLSGEAARLVGKGVRSYVILRTVTLWIAALVLSSVVLTLVLESDPVPVLLQVAQPVLFLLVVYGFYHTGGCGDLVDRLARRLDTVEKVQEESGVS